MKSLSNKIDDVLRNSSHLTWLNDYKTYGYRSYVYQDKNVLHELYEDYNLCMNDDMIRDEAFDYIISLNKDVGKALSGFYGINSKHELSLLHSIYDIVNSSVAINAIFGNEIATKLIISKPTFMKALNNSSVAIGKYIALLAGLNPAAYSSVNDVLNNTSIYNSEPAINAMFNSSLAVDVLVNSETAMNTITSSGPALCVIAKSGADWSTKKPFVMKLNTVGTYISNVYAILTNTTYFTYKIDTGSSTNIPSLDSYANAEYAANGFIACALGSNTSTSGYGSRLKINNDIIKEVVYPDAPYYPSNITDSNVNAIAIPTATFESIIGGCTRIAVYIAK